MENYSVYGRLSLDVSKDFKAEGDQDAINKAYELLNESSNIVSIILKDINGNEIEFNRRAPNRNLHYMDVEWETVFNEDE